MGICSVGQFSAKLSTGVGKDWGEGGQAGSESEPHMHLTRVASLADIEAMGPPPAILGRECRDSNLRSASGPVVGVADPLKLLFVGIRVHFYFLG